ncbi:hypothetical protein BGZ96_000229 [Linnemannia gamsii]|uniref:F-box domain-containing protein n=1 Tax=Linnemannia gamsii TaxID=64522 RepID=A0ABQ7KBG6_9FUNG|nr:hypothetical protein BGZ96_000229 [Linnemannia gamsii]
MAAAANPPPSQSHQSFRLRSFNSSTDEVRIVIRKDTTSGQNFVLWNDIISVFRNAGHVQHGSDVVPYMTDSQFEYLRPLRIEAYPGIVLEVVLVSTSVSGQDSVASSIPYRETLIHGQGNNTLEEQLQLERIGTQSVFAAGTMQQEQDTSMPPPYEIAASTPSSSSPPPSSSSSRRISTASTPSPTSERTSVQHRISTAISPPSEPSTLTSLSAAAEAAAATWLIPDGETVSPTPRAGGGSSRASQQFIARVQSILLDSTHQLEVYEQSILSEPSARSDFLIRGVETIQQGLNSIHQELHDVVPTLRAEIAKNTTLQLQILEMQTAADEMARRMLDIQQHAIELQEQTLDRLATIQGRVSAILTQTYELHEYPIPRLFIILPKEDGTRTEALRNVFAKQFKLHFLCECNNHSRHSRAETTTGLGVDNQGMTAMQRQDIHLARHEGYDLDRPNEFFEKYGSYVLTLLQMLKYGAVVAGVVIPPLAQLKIADGLDTAKQSADVLYSSMEPKVDSAIEYLQGLSSSNQGSSTTENTSYENNLEALEGADLRQLSSFLKINDEGRVLGNLYRTVTGEGHVKWVCLDHYRETYGLSAQRELREVVESSRGRYDEPTGTVSIELISPVQARQFYSILATSRYVQELRLTMSWDTTLEDYRSLKEALQQSNVIRLELAGNMTSGPKTDILNRNRRHDPFLQLMAGGKLKMLSIRGVKDFLERTNKVPSIIHIRTFELQSSVVTSKDGPQLEKLVLAAPMLYELVLLVQDIDAMFTLLSPLIKKLKRFRTLTLHQATSRTTISFQYDPAATDDKAPIISLTGDGIESTKLALIHRVRTLTIQKYQETHQIQELVSRVVKKHQSSLEVVEIKCLADHFPSVTDWFHREIKGYDHKTLRQFVLHDGFNSVVIRDFQNSMSPTSKLELEEISTCESDNPAQNLTTLFEKHGSEIKVLDLDHNFTQLQASKFLQSVRQAQGAKLRTLTWDITKTWDGRIFRDMLLALRMCDPTVLQWVSIKINQGYKDVFQNHQLQQQPQAGIVTVLDDQSGSSGRENLGMVLKKKTNRLELRARGLNVIISKLQAACNSSGGPFEQLEELYIRGFEEKFGGRSVKWVQSLMQRDISTRMQQQQQLSVPVSQEEPEVDTRPLSMSSDAKMSGDPTTPNPAAMVPAKPLAAFRRLTSVTLFHVHLVPLSWELLINSIDFLTIRYLDFTLTNFTDPELQLLTRRCLSKVKKCSAIMAAEEIADLSLLGVEERLAVEDLREQAKFGLMVWLDRTDVSQATVGKLRGEIEEAKCCWLKFGGLQA